MENQCNTFWLLVNAGKVSFYEAALGFSVHHCRLHVCANTCEQDSQEAAERQSDDDSQADVS